MPTLPRCGMKTLDLRMERQCSNALRVAWNIWKPSGDCQRSIILVAVAPSASAMQEANVAWAAR